MRGIGFEPEEEMLARYARCAFLLGFKSGLQYCRSRRCSLQDMRGTGFEPADLYRTAPSTLRRWPSLATHARSSNGTNCSVAFRFNPFRSLPTSLPSRGPRLLARPSTHWTTPSTDR